MTEADHEIFAAYGRELVDAIERAVPAWVERCVESRLDQDAVRSEELTRRIAESGSAASTDVGRRLRELLGRDIDDQWTNPLSIVRDAVRYPNRILADQGVPAVERDRHAVKILPDDIYNLAPANFAALGSEVHECGIRWGAAKAHLHLKRHKKS